jgi:hypothetical protein
VVLVDGGEESEREVRERERERHTTQHHTALQYTTHIPGSKSAINCTSLANRLLMVPLFLTRAAGLSSIA